MQFLLSVIKWLPNTLGVNFRRYKSKSSLSVFAWNVMQFVEKNIEFLFQVFLQKYPQILVEL